MAEISYQDAQVLTITNPAPNLDPIDVIFLDHSPGRGRIIVRVYSQAWTAWFSAMGDHHTVRTFVRRPRRTTWPAPSCTGREISSARDRASCKPPTSSASCGRSRTHSARRGQAVANMTIGNLMKSAPKPAAVGEIWHRVDGSHLGDEVYEGMELSWTAWRCDKVTKCGAWFVCTEWHARDRVFAATSGARNLHRTDVEALKALIARKQRQLVILNGQKVAAEDTLGVARETLPKLEAYRASGRDRP